MRLDDFNVSSIKTANTFQRHSVSKTLAQREPFFFPTSFSIYIEFDRH